MKILLPLLRLYCLVLATFLFIQRPLFILFNGGRIDEPLGLVEIWDIYKHGIVLDISATGYIVALPSLLIFCQYFVRKDSLQCTLKYLCLLIALILSVVTVTDASLYEFWNFKMDNTVLLYITDPKNALASVSIWYTVWHTLLVVFLTWGLYLLYTWAAVKGCDYFMACESEKNWKVLLILLLYVALVFMGIRGIDLVPMSAAKAYYSPVTFYNHSAVNPVFNFISSVTHRGGFRKEFRFYDDAEVETTVLELFPTEGRSDTVFNSRRPNILYIIIEGMGSLYIDKMNDDAGHVPVETGELPSSAASHLAVLAQESLCFDTCYCGSFCTDRGLVCAISGYIGQPTASIMHYTKKTATLPGLPKVLRENGYETQMLYGGDATFFNMSTYLYNAGFSKVISQEDFPTDQRLGDLGVHDNITAERVFDDISKMSVESTKPFFYTWLTLSSHEPFDVPYDKFKDKRINAYAFTDECVGTLINRLKDSPMWENLVVIITADHSPHYLTSRDATFPLIPFMMLGGAVSRTGHIATPVSQTDIPATILGQLGLPHSEFTFSRDVLADTYKNPFAFYTFNSGFHFRDTTGVTIYYDDQKSAILGSDSERERKGKSILQYLYNDIDKRGE